MFFAELDGYSFDSERNKLPKSMRPSVVGRTPMRRSGYRGTTFDEVYKNYDDPAMFNRISEPLQKELLKMTLACRRLERGWGGGFDTKDVSTNLYFSLGSAYQPLQSGVIKGAFIVGGFNYKPVLIANGLRIAGLVQVAKGDWRRLAVGGHSGGTILDIFYEDEVKDMPDDMDGILQAIQDRTAFGWVDRNTK